jgi:hypothetical protein
MGGRTSPKRIKAEAYLYAESIGTDKPLPIPNDLMLLGYIDRFGVEAVMGRPILSAGEMRRMAAQENIVTAYQSRKTSENWAEWATKNPSLVSILADVESILDAD